MSRPWSIMFWKRREPRTMAPTRPSKHCMSSTCSLTCFILVNAFARSWVSSVSVAPKQPGKPKDKNNPVHTKRNEKESYEQCQAWLASTAPIAPHISLSSSRSLYACRSGRVTLFHAFWHGTFKRTTVLSELSFLATQPLDCSRLIVWHTGDEIFNEFTGQILDLVHDSRTGPRTYNTSLTAKPNVQKIIEFHHKDSLVA